MFKIFRLLFYVIQGIVIVVLLAIHFVLKERTFSSSLYFYTFPLPIIIAIILVFSVFLKKKLRQYNLLLAGVLVVVWLGQSFKIHFSDDVKTLDLEIVFWNAARDNSFESAFEENNTIPDVLVLVEYAGSNLEATQLKYPEYYFATFKKEEIGVFSKTPIQILKREVSKYGSAIINFRTRGVNFYAVDVQGSTDVPRSWELGFVNKALVQTRNTVVLGDFNVPCESKYLEDIKVNFNNAFNEKGNGFSETWLWGLPLLSLDYIWVSKDLKVIKTKKINTFKSDHSMIKTVVRWSKQCSVNSVQ